MPTDEEFREAGLATSRPSPNDVVIETGDRSRGPDTYTEVLAYEAAQAAAGSAAPPVVAEDLAGLGDGAFDGQVGLIRIGTFPDFTEYEFTWVDSESAWIGSNEFTLMTTRDTWGLDLSNKELADFRNAWTRFSSGLPYGKPARSYLTSTQNLAALAGNELAISNSTDFSSTGTVRVRGKTLNYTGKGSGKLTGVSASTGTYPANNTIVTQGEIAGWGTDSIPLDNVGDMYDAGFALEMRANAWMNGSQDSKTMSVGPYFHNTNAAESFALPDSPPTNGFGFGPTLTGPSDPGAANRAAERTFEWVDSGWTTFAGSPTDRFLFCSLYGKMNDAAAEDNGEVYGYTLKARWVSA